MVVKLSTRYQTGTGMIHEPRKKGLLQMTLEQCRRREMTKSTIRGMQIVVVGDVVTSLRRYDKMHILNPNPVFSLNRGSTYPGKGGEPLMSGRRHYDFS